MKVTLSYAEQQTAQKANADLDRFAKALTNAHGLDLIELQVDAGLVLITGFDIQGKKATTALGFSTLRQQTAATLAAYTIQRLRKKLYNEDAPSRRRHMGQLHIPDGWWS